MLERKLSHLLFCLVWLFLDVFGCVNGSKNSYNQIALSPNFHTHTHIDKGRSRTAQHSTTQHKHGSLTSLNKTKTKQKKKESSKGRKES